MYESRLHATNGVVSVAVDARNGELLELVSEKVRENVIKSNCHPKAWSPFVLEIKRGMKNYRVRPARYLEILDDPTLLPSISIDQQEDSASISIDYPAVFGDEGRMEIKVHVEIALPKGENRLQWNIQVKNDSSEEVQRVLFPNVAGLFLGETWTDDHLIFPYHAGMDIPNPVKEISYGHTNLLYNKWQEYSRAWPINGPVGRKDDRDCYVYEGMYSGQAAMLWMDLYDKAADLGVYITCRNNNLIMKGLHVETFGESSPTLGMAIIHFPCINPGESWESEVCVVALHGGDWHWAADDYRAWRQTLPRLYDRPHMPDWYLKSPGLVAHYDFKYQGGGIVHKFKDIPGLLEQAKSLGMNHILISGWNYDGFDNGFPQYWPDPELGTEEELRDAVHKVREMGGHVAFYINSRIVNNKYEDRQQLIHDCTIMQADGTLPVEQYGARDLKFSCMCNQTEGWHDLLVKTVDYLTNNIGADSMYLDQLCSPSRLCYHPDHAHGSNHSGWNQGYQKILNDMRKNYAEEGVCMIYENNSDAYAEGVCLQLASTMFYTDMHSAPEVYRYTFPDHGVVDMMNTSRYSAMRPEHFAQRSTFLLYTAFVTGMYLWVYDLEQDNTFRHDQEQWARLVRQCNLRRTWLETYGQGTFRDDIGIIGQTEGLMAKRFDIQDGVLLAAADHKGIKDKWIEFNWEGDHTPDITIRTDRAPEAEALADFELVCKGGKMTVRVHMDDADELAVFILR